MDRLRHIWHNMKYRCFTESCPVFHRYGGRGITMCDEWLNFDTFKEWSLSHGYKNNLCIDRINNDGDYEPSNCQWITRGENTARANHLFVRRKPDGGNAYWGISPNGEVFVFTNASEFVREHPELNLRARGIRKAACGKCKTYKGYTFGYIKS